MKKTTLTIAAIIIATVWTFSQSVTETRRIKTTALQIYENYKVVMSDLYSKSDYTEDNFMALFDDNTLLYNDIIPSNTPAQLSPKRYFQNFKANIKRIYPSFSNFRLGEPVSVENKWQIKCNFTGDTRFRTQKDMNYPEWSFNYTLTIEMDKRYDENKKVYENAKITNVQVDNPLKSFFIIENKENTPLVTKSGETLNGWDKEYQSRIFPEDKWKINDIQISKSGNNGNIFEYSKSSFSKNRADANFYQLNVQKIKKNIFGIGVGYDLNSSENKTSEANVENFQRSNALSFSLFYGKQIAHKEKSTLFFNVGLDLNIYSYKYSGVNSIIDSINDGAADDDKNLHYREIMNIPTNDEKVNITSISVPLSVQYLYQLSQNSRKPVFLSFELGVFAESALPSTKKENLNADFHGVYSVNFNGETQDVTFDHYYNYGNDILIDRTLKLDFRFDFGILGGVGLWFTLNNNNLLKLSISYRQGFNSSLKYNEDYDIPKHIPQGMTDDDRISQSLNTKQGLQNIYFGLSWVKTIGGK